MRTLPRLRVVFKDEGSVVGGLFSRLDQATCQTPRALGSETSSAQPVGFSGNSVFYFISSPWACIPLLRGRLRASRRSVRISSVLGSLKMPVTVARSCRVISKCVLNGGIKFKATNTLYRGFVIGFGQVVGELGMGRK